LSASPHVGPTEGPTSEYNPLDYGNLTVNLVRELMSRGPYPLPPAEAFAGAGVYALFYTGAVDYYGRVASPECDQPIYVGKAVPRGARKGIRGGTSTPGHPLFDRLREHGRSIAAGAELDLADFKCRYLVVTPLWITMAERFLIENFQPIWNLCLDGFGNHPQGSGRQRQEVSWWDALHPGRTAASALRQTRTRSDALRQLGDWYHTVETNPAAARSQAAQAAEAAETDTP